VAELRIHWDNMDEVAEARKAEAEGRLRELVAQHDDLLSLRVSGHHSAHHRHGDREVRIVAKAKGRDLFVSRVRPDLSLALHDAVDAFTREIRNLRSRRVARPAQRAESPPLLGLVDRVLPSEGYGFIVTDAGESVYFHRNAVSGGLAFERLEEGQRIGLNVEPGDEGLQATVVVPAPPDAPSP
jgi:cold shock CspA family protein/ribosome-associated translation inhibitor RaiA